MGFIKICPICDFNVKKVIAEIKPNHALIESLEFLNNLYYKSEKKMLDKTKL